MLETAMSELRRTEERLVEPRAEATRTTILDAAERIFAERGFAGTSMRELAREAQTSQALLHHHFGTKAGLYDAVKQRFTDRYNAERRPKVDSNEDLSVVGGAVLGYFEFLRANPNLSRLTSWARLEGDRKPWGGEDEIWHSLLAWAEEAKARGQIRKDVDPKLLDDAAMSGDRFAIEFMEEMGTYLGAALASALNLLDLHLVIVGGGLSKAESSLLEPARRALRMRALKTITQDVELRVARFHNDAGVIGAALLGLELRQRTTASSTQRVG